MNQLLVEDLLRPQQGDAARIGEPAGVGIEILDLAQAARHRGGIVEVHRPRDLQREGPQPQRHAELGLERVSGILGEKGIRASEVEPEIDGLGHGR
jgi:hypothetical protein